MKTKEELRNEFEIILKDKLKNIQINNSDYTFNKIIEAMEVAYNLGQQKQPVEISDKEIEDEAKMRCTTFTAHYWAINAKWFRKGAKWMRDKQGIAPNKEVEWSDNMFQGSNDKRMEIINEFYIGSEFDKNAISKALQIYSNLCQKELFKQLQKKNPA